MTPEQKAEFLEQSKAHLAADMLIQGDYISENGAGAGQALTGLCANGGGLTNIKISYQFADAMLSERAKREESQ